MIWTIVIWMAMQKQRHIPLSQCGIQANSDTIIDCSRPLDDPGIVPQKNYMMPPNLMEPVTPTAPAEHVFEIRTVQEVSTRSSKTGKCAEGFPEPSCNRTIRELYMDGKRMGIIKGLE